MTFTFHSLFIHTFIHSCTSMILKEMLLVYEEPKTKACWYWGKTTPHQRA